MSEKIYGDGFYVSYANGRDIFGDWMNETALYDGDEWRILEGNWLDEYEPLVPRGLAACIEFYESKSGEFRSGYSVPVPNEES